MKAMLHRTRYKVNGANELNANLRTSRDQDNLRRGWTDNPFHDCIGQISILLRVIDPLLPSVQNEQDLLAVMID